MAEGGKPDIEALGSRIVYRNNWMTVREDAIRRPDGSTGIYGVVDKPDFVVVVPLQADGSLQLVQQFRYPVAARCWEFPLGTWGPPGTDPALVARHELQEETGLAAATLTHAGYLHVALGTINQGYHIFLALAGQSSVTTLRDQTLNLHSLPKQMTAVGRCRGARHRQAGRTGRHPVSAVRLRASRTCARWCA